MNQSFDVQLQQIFSQVRADIVGAIPRLIAAVLLVTLAFLSASIVERGLRLALVRLRFDQLLRRVGIDHWLQKAGVRQPMNDFVPRVAYFLLLFVFARSAADLLGLTALSTAIGAALDFLPRLITALAILLIGGALASFVGSSVRQLAENAGIEFSGSLGSAASVVTMGVLAMMALAQLGIDTEFVRLIVGIVTAGAVFAAALSLGLGTRDISRSIIAGYYARRTFQIGEPMTIVGESGTLVAITPTQALLQDGETVIAVPNAAFLDGVVRQ